MRNSIRIACCLAVLGLGCTLAPGPIQDHSRAAKHAGAPTAVQADESVERAIIRTASISLEVDEIVATSERIAAVAERLGGLVESSNSSEERAWLQLRVPSASIDAALDEIGSLGKETARNRSARDVTEQLADLEASLANDRALRDRLRLLLDRAKTVEEVLKVENQLNRLQTKIDQQEGRQKRLRSQVDLSAISVQLQRTRILGPLGYVFEGVRWAVRSLFVIR